MQLLRLTGSIQDQTFRAKVIYYKQNMTALARCDTFS